MNIKKMYYGKNMKYIFYILFILFSVILSSCKDNVVVVDSGAIKVKVFNSSDLKPIGGVQISTSPPTEVSLTNSNGEYLIKNCYPGTYIVNGMKDGYNVNSSTISVTKGNTTLATIILTDLISSNHPPDQPVYITPSNSQILNKKNVNIEWSCTDQDNDVLKYDLYISKTNPPTKLISENMPQTSYTYSATDDSTDYYWKVIAKDKYGATSEGQIFKFSVMTSSTKKQIVSKKD